MTYYSLASVAHGRNKITIFICDVVLILSFILTTPIYKELSKEDLVSEGICDAVSVKSKIH